MELKPCPFCGNKRIVMSSMEYKTNPIFSTVHFLCCQNIDCRAEGPVDLGESGAIERWNTRPGECAEPSPTPKEPHTNA